MGCLQVKAALYSVNGSPLVDTRYVRDGKARLMSPGAGLAARKLGSTHRKSRPASHQRPEPILDELGIGSPPSSPGPNSPAHMQESRHRRAAALLQRLLRQLAHKTNPKNAGRKSDYWLNQQPQQRAAVSLFGNSRKTALQLGELLSTGKHRQNAYLVNTVFMCLLSQRFSPIELINAATHREIVAALRKHGPECPIYPSLCCNGIFLLLKIASDSRFEYSSLLLESKKYTVDSTPQVHEDKERKDASAILRAIEWAILNGEVFERLMRRHLEEEDNGKQRKGTGQKFRTLKCAVGELEQTKQPTATMTRAEALRKMCGSVYFERQRRGIPKQNNFCSVLVRKERQAILTVDDCSPFLQVETKPDQVQKLGRVLRHRDPNNERLLLHLLLECIDEIKYLQPETVHLKNCLLSETFGTQITHLLETSITSVAESQFWRSRPSIMAACCQLLSLVDSITDDKFSKDLPCISKMHHEAHNDSFQENNTTLPFLNVLRRWKSRNPLTSACLDRQLALGFQHELPETQSKDHSLSSCPQVSSNDEDHGGDDDEGDDSILRTRSEKCPASPTTRLGLASLQTFQNLQVELHKAAETLLSPSSQNYLVQNIIDRTLQHSLEVMKDECSTADNKLEVGRFMLDVLATRSLYRKCMRASKHWTAVELVLTWCRFNDVLLLSESESRNVWETMDGMRSAGLHSLVLPGSKISLETLSGRSRTNANENQSVGRLEHSIYALPLSTSDSEETLSSKFSKFLCNLKHLDCACREVATNESPQNQSLARLFPFGNNWTESLQRGGDAIARASLNGPLGVVDMMDFHSGNPFILERGCTILISDNCSARVLLAAGAVEVVARSLRKVPKKHAFYLSTAVKASCLLVRAFNGEREETSRRLMACECDVCLADLVAWADSNASVFMPTLSTLGSAKRDMKEIRHENVWMTVLRPSAQVMLDIALVKSIESLDVVGTIPSRTKVDIVESNQKWAKILFTNKEGDTLTGWVARQSIRRPVLKLLPTI